MIHIIHIKADKIKAALPLIPSGAGLGNLWHNFKCLYAKRKYDVQRSLEEDTPFAMTSHRDESCDWKPSCIPAGMPYHW